MDIEYELRGVRFRWNEDKAKLNTEKHGISFEQAAQVFFDPFLRRSTLRAMKNRATARWAAISTFGFCSSCIWWSRTNTFE